MYPTGAFEDGDTATSSGPSSASSTGSGGAGGGTAGCLGGTPVMLADGQATPTELALAPGRVLWIASDGTIRATERDRTTPANGDEADVFATPVLAPRLLRAGGRVAWTRGNDHENCLLGTLVESTTFDGTEYASAQGTCYYPIPALVADQGIAFWTWSNLEGARLSKTPFPGTTTELTMLSGSISRLAVTTDEVWFAHVDPVAPPTLYRVPRTFDAATVPTPVLESAGAVFAMTADATHVYWTSELGDVRRCPRQGCDEETVETLAGDQPSAGDLAVDDAAVYWVTTANGGAVMCAPLSGGSPQVVAAAPGGAASIEIDASGLYWADTASGEVRALRR